MKDQVSRSDIVFLGTFGAWNLGTIQSRALPFARQLHTLGYSVSIVTTPWDMSLESGCLDTSSGVNIINTASASSRFPVQAVAQQLEWIERLNPQIVHLFKPRGFGGFSVQFLPYGRLYILDSDDWEGDGGWNDSRKYGPIARRLFEWQEKSLISNASVITGASTLLVERARRLRQAMPPDTVRYLPNGLEQSWADQLGRTRRDASARWQQHRILFYSRFEEFSPYWIDHFCNALADVAQDPVNVLIVGRLPGNTAVSPMYGHVSVTAVGFASRRDLPSLLQSATLAVYPYEDSLITRSKQSVKLLELMAAGCPVVASVTGENRVTLGQAGFVLKGSDPVEYAIKISRLLNQPELLADMSEIGVKRVQDQFTFEKLTPGLVEIYKAAGLRSTR